MKDKVYFEMIPDSFFKYSFLYFPFIIFSALFFFFIAFAFILAPTELHQGSVYKILYLHVPSAFTAFLSSFFLGILSLFQLYKKKGKYQFLAQAIAEVGLLFTVMTLLTGMIWGRPTWGVWWTWDARLTTTLILAILYSAYLLLNSSLANLQLKSQVCSVVALLIMFEVPIIYKSVTWWRTLHQPPSLLVSSGTKMSPEILYPLIFVGLSCFLFSSWLVWQRFLNLNGQEQLNRMLLASFSRRMK